jgi:hypothetical protein
MSLVKLVEIEKGWLTFRVFRMKSEAVFFGAIDEERDGRSKRSPLMTVRDLRCLLDLLERQQRVLSRRIETRVRQTQVFATEGVVVVPKIEEETRSEIERAIKKVQGRNTSSITVLPTMPDYQYVYTCEVCGCHLSSHLRLYGGSVLKMCANCGYEPVPSEAFINRTQLAQSSIDKNAEVEK